MSKHTPGPWRVGSTLGMNANMICVGDDNEGIASVYGIPFNTDVSDPYLKEKRPKALANAYLIAAAPELLAALERVRLEWNESKFLKLATRQAVDAAINKAGGEMK